MGGMRILHLVARSQRRGAEMAALELAHELDALGHDDRVLALGLAFDGGREPELPVLAERRRTGPLALAPTVWRMRRLLDREPFDVILAHGGWPAQVAAFARRRGGAPLVWQRILGFPSQFWHPVRRRWWRAVTGRTDAAVALTPELGDELRQLGFTGPIWVIANTRRPERFINVDRVEAAARLHREIGVPDTVPLLGFVGHLIDQKRPERALDVLARVLDAEQPAHLVVAGGGPLRGRVEQEIRDRRLDGHVSLLGHRRDVEQVLGGIDLFLLTSDAEGIPGVAIEAQMAGCPVVTFPLGAVSDVVDDGRTGVVLDRVADTESMAARAVELLQQPDVRRRLGDEGRRRAQAFSTSDAAAEYAARFTELVAGRVPG
jgi:glycosyltransferase involved in cell wall biosynthesis